MTEKDKMLAGLWYDANDQELVAQRDQTKDLLLKINNTPKTSVKYHQGLQSLIGKHPGDFVIEPPFFCDYGTYIELGKGVYINSYAVFLDSGRIEIGDHTLLGPNVSIYTSTHPIEDVDRRRAGFELAQTVTIGRDCWIGGNVVILPGVELGDRVVVGAGSVVTKSFPADVVIAGNPARVIRTL